MRYKKVKVSGAVLVNLLTSDELHVEITDGLPEGTKFAYSIPDTMQGIWLVIEHESFPELSEGQIIPEFEGEIKARNLEKPQ